MRIRNKINNSIDTQLRKKCEDLTALMDTMSFETDYDRKKEYAKRLKAYIKAIPKPLWTDEVKRCDRFCKLDFEAVKLWDGTDESIDQIEDIFIRNRVRKAVDEYKAYYKKRFDRFERIKNAEMTYPGKENDIDNMLYYINAAITHTEIGEFEEKRGQEAIKRYAESNDMKIFFDNNKKR